jgi:hypothetical protein
MVVIQNTPLYRISGDEAEWIGALDIGEPLELDAEALGLETLPNKPVSFEPRRLASDDRRVYLIPVRQTGGAGRRGWIDMRQYAEEGAALAAFTAREFEFRTETETRMIRYGDLLVLKPDYSGASPAIYSPFFDFSYEGMSIALSSISLKPEDTGAAALLARAGGKRSRESALALLEASAELYSESLFYPLIKEQIAGEPETTDRDGGTELINAVFSTARDQVPIRPEPDFNAPVLAFLEIYTDVRTFERTAALSETESGRARWYHVDGADPGWVFGLDLEGAD